MFASRRLRHIATGVGSAPKLTYEQCAQIRQENLFPCMTAHFKEPLLIERGEMQYLYDHKGFFLLLMKFLAIFLSFWKTLMDSFNWIFVPWSTKSVRTIIIW